jgi:hypothetical protein
VSVQEGYGKEGRKRKKSYDNDADDDLYPTSHVLRFPFDPSEPRSARRPHRRRTRDRRSAPVAARRRLIRRRSTTRLMLTKVDGCGGVDDRPLLVGEGADVFVVGVVVVVVDRAGVVVSGRGGRSVVEDDGDVHRLPGGS